MSWIKKAVILGLVFFIAVLIVKPIGVSTQYSVLSGIIHKTVKPDVIWEDQGAESGYASSNAYYDRGGGKLAKAIEHPFNYDFIFVLAIPLGGYLGSLIYRKNARKNNHSEKCNLEKRSFIKEYGPSFISGFLLLYGARLADGCTSGHMMSGIMQGSVSGYIFAACAFVIAIPTAVIVQKIREHGGAK